MIAQGLCKYCSQPTFGSVCYACQLRPDIALVGRMASGKTTLARTLIAMYDYTRVSHADGIKEMAALAYGIVNKTDTYEVRTLKGELELLSGREVLQGVGQTMKLFDRDFWLKISLNRTSHISGPVVNDDTRFVFESEALREIGFKVVRVNTPDEVRMARYVANYGREPTPAELAHESEREIDAIPVDYEVNGMMEPEAAARQVFHGLRPVVDGLRPVAAMWKKRRG